MHDQDAVRKRMAELMEPVDQQIMMTDDPKEMLMIACAMMQRTNEIFRQVLGDEGARRMYEDMK
jgi:transcriptional regulator with PAS, ATPase and Fis domain